MNRAERRRQEREQGWAMRWERKPTPRELGRKLAGWANEVDAVWANGKYAVLIREVKSPWGPVQHAAISTLASTDIPWRDKQRIKNELFGPERVAIEVFPAESQMVDGANMYHLWVLPPGTALPFGLHTDPSTEVRHADDRHPETPAHPPGDAERPGG